MTSRISRVLTIPRYRDLKIFSHPVEPREGASWTGKQATNDGVLESRMGRYGLPSERVTNDGMVL